MWWRPTWPKGSMASGQRPTAGGSSPTFERPGRSIRRGSVSNCRTGWVWSGRSGLRGLAMWWVSTGDCGGSSRSDQQTSKSLWRFATELPLAVTPAPSMPPDRTRTSPDPSSHWSRRGKAAPQTSGSTLAISPRWWGGVLGWGERSTAVLTHNAWSTDWREPDHPRARWPAVIWWRWWPRRHCEEPPWPASTPRWSASSPRWGRELKQARATSRGGGGEMCCRWLASGELSSRFDPSGWSRPRLQSVDGPGGKGRRLATWPAPESGVVTVATTTGWDCDRDCELYVSAIGRRRGRPVGAVGDDGPARNRSTSSTARPSGPVPAEPMSADSAHRRPAPCPPILG